MLYLICVEKCIIKRHLKIRKSKYFKCVIHEIELDDLILNILEITSPCDANVDDMFAMETYRKKVHSKISSVDRDDA